MEKQQPTCLFQSTYNGPGIIMKDGSSEVMLPWLLATPSAAWRMDHVTLIRISMMDILQETSYSYGWYAYPNQCMQKLFFLPVESDPQRNMKMFLSDGWYQQVNKSQSMYWHSFNWRISISLQLSLIVINFKNNKLSFVLASSKLYSQQRQWQWQLTANPIMPLCNQSMAISPTSHISGAFGSVVLVRKQINNVKIPWSNTNDNCS